MPVSETSINWFVCQTVPFLCVVTNTYDMYIGIESCSVEIRMRDGKTFLECPFAA